MGALAGGYLGFAMAQRFVDIIFASQVETRFVDKVLLLKLIEDGKVEAARTSLLVAVQSDAILVGSQSSTATSGTSAESPIPTHPLRQNVWRIEVRARR